MRNYPAPRAVKASSIDRVGPLAASITAEGALDSDQLERAIWSSDRELADWARGVLDREHRQTLDEVLGDSLALPRAAPDHTSDEEDIVVGLMGEDGRIFTKDGWSDPPEEDLDEEHMELLDEESVAYVASAFQDGADGVVLRMWFPLAIIAAGDPSTEVNPEGSAVIAVVDDLDQTAVLDVLRISPGPVVERRNDGAWVRDPGWLTILRSPKPPPCVKLDDAVTGSVLSQVDESTSGMAFEPVDVNEALQADGWMGEILQHSHEAGITFALLAAKGAGNVTNPVATERLRQYWTRGKGALKIRWGTPGSWTRCRRNLAKYMGPRAAGYCTRLCERLGGYGVACHVGDAHK